jgi:two-component system CheB/CheR fusion protein
MAPIGKRAVETLAIAIVYIATAQPGFLIAIAPGNVTVAWPPSGIALAAMILLGYRAWPGVWLGSFLVNLLFFIFHNVLLTTAVATASSIAAGSVLQALLAAFLYRRILGTHIPHALQGVLKFTTIVVLSCLIAATAGTSSLAFSSAIAWTSYTDTWLTWWLGDLVGMLTVAPVLLVVGYRIREGRGLWGWAFPLMSGAAGVSVIAGYNIWRLGDQAVAGYLGISPAWLSWGVFGIGLLFALLLASGIEYYLGIEAELHESEARARRQLLELETLYRTAPIGLALVDRDLRFLRINDKLAEIDGAPVEACIGRTLRDVTPGVADTVEPLYRQVLETGQAVLHREVHGTTPAQPAIERAWLVDYYPIKEPDGSVQAVAAIIVEITERNQAEARQRLLLRELNHRVKNSLAVVQAIARQTLAGASSPAAFVEAFEGRLRAVAITHNLLTGSNWQGAQLASLVREELRAHSGDGRVEIAGEDVLLDPALSGALGLVVHELATNAAKHGSLSVPTGRVAVGWTVGPHDGARHLDFLWRETGGPEVQPPSRRGFGSMLIERSLTKGRVGLNFAPSGLVCRIELPLA